MPGPTEHRKLMVWPIACIMVFCYKSLFYNINVWTLRCLFNSFFEFNAINP